MGPLHFLQAETLIVFVLSDFSKMFTKWTALKDIAYPSKAKGKFVYFYV